MEAQVGQHVVLSRLHRGHLLKQVLARQESHRGEERDDPDRNAVIAGIRVLIVQAVATPRMRRDGIALRRYAGEHHDGEQLKADHGTMFRA